MLLTWFVMSPWGRSLLWGPHPVPPDVIAALPSTWYSDNEMKRGNLEWKFLTAEELRDLGISMDLEHVPYWGAVDLGRWAPVFPMDRIPALTHPKYTTVQETDSWLKEDDLVLGVVYKGIVRAYPVRVLDRHEIVNDQLGDTPVAVTYSPLTFSGIVFRRPVIAERVLEFGVSGRLYNANLLMYDRQTGSLWSQFLGEVIAGPLLGKAATLIRLPADIVSWGIWKQAHPDTQVLERPSTVRTPSGGTQYLTVDRYDRYIYEEYRLKQEIGYGVDIRQLNLRGISSKRKVVGVIVNDMPKAYEEFLIKDTEVINDDVGSEPIVLLRAPDDRIRAFRRTLNSQVLRFALQDGHIIDQETQTVWSFDGVAQSGPLRAQGSHLEELVVTPSFWFAWVAFYPDTELYSEAH